MTYAEHIAQLCEQLNVQHRADLTLVGRSCGSPLDGWIQTPPVDDELTYFVALHELGHCAHQHEGHGWWGVDSRVLLKEGEAWARDTAMHAPSPEIAALCLSFLLTYLRDFDRVRTNLRAVGQDVPEVFGTARSWLTTYAEAV